MSLIPIYEGKKIIGYSEVEDNPNDTSSPIWKDWKGGEYDNSDGKFVSGKSHVILLGGRIGRADGTHWHGVSKYRRAIPGDIDAHPLL